MSSIVMENVNFLINQLKKDASKSMFRRKGFLIGPSNVVQHLNPACRAARSVPHLSLARLLISLNDFDVPKAKPSKMSILGYFYEVAFWLLVLFVLMLSIIPELLQEVCVESTMAVIVNMIYFSIFAGGGDLYVAFGVGTALVFGLFFAVEIIIEIRRHIRGCK